jgi:alkylation response protein AidB-like acyl-CoA dehydrogenase
MTDAAILEAAAALAPHIRSQADAIEKARRLPPPVVDQLARAGLLRMLVPRALGGGEVAPETMVRAVETIARADAAAGWCVMVHATAGLMSAYLDEDAAREVYGDPTAIACGVFAPTGKAVDEGEHYRVSGRWAFASGVEHSGWRMVGAVVTDAAGEVPAPSGQPVTMGETPMPPAQPVVRHFLLRADETRVVDTWDVSGLRGTGSHDLTASNALVPKRWSASLVSDRPRHPGVLYRFPIFGVLSLGIAAVALGVAREAIGALSALATEKRPAWSKRSLAHRELTQAHVAEAEGLVRSARAFLFEALGEVAQVAASRAEMSERERALLRLAATQATRASTRAVDLMYHAGGGSSIYAASPLQRYFRDIHVVTQHVMVAEATYAVVGRVLLGLGSDAGML